MKPSNARSQRITQTMEAAGHRLTEPRLQLIDAVAAQADKAFTGEDLYDDLKSTGLGRATVFRTLKLLQDLGILARLHLEDGCQRYIVTPEDPGQGAHHHDRLICRECGKVGFLDRCPLPKSIRRIAAESGYEVDTHHLDILGVCTECQGKV